VLAALYHTGRGRRRFATSCGRTCARIGGCCQSTRPRNRPDGPA
jgi:hypothetical protein